MITNQDVTDQINLSYATIDECYKRWKQVPGPSAERRTKQTEFAARRKEQDKKHAAIIENVRKPVAERLQSANKQVAEVEAKVAAAENPSEQKALQKELSKLRTDVNTISGEHNGVYQQWLRQQASEELLAIRDEADQLLTDVGEYDALVARGTALGEQVKAQIEQDVKDFDDANTYHLNQASWTLRALIAFAVISALITVLVFLWLPGGGSNPTGTAAMVERGLLTGIGRVALLLFLGWTIRYLGGLHKSHAEQAVLYRDRKAALGVAKILLQSSERLEHKQEVLQTMTRTY